MLSGAPTPSKSVTAFNSRRGEDLKQLAVGPGRRGQWVGSSGKGGGGGGAAAATPLVAGNSREVKGATLKVTVIDPESLKVFLKFASSGSQQATDALNMLAQELAQGQARNARSAEVCSPAAATR